MKGKQQSNGQRTQPENPYITFTVILFFRALNTLVELFLWVFFSRQSIVFLVPLVNLVLGVVSLCFFFFGPKTSNHAVEWLFLLASVSLLAQVGGNGLPVVLFAEERNTLSLAFSALWTFFFFFSACRVDSTAQPLAVVCGVYYASCLAVEVMGIGQWMLLRLVAWLAQVGLLVLWGFLTCVLIYVADFYHDITRPETSLWDLIPLCIDLWLQNRERESQQSSTW